MIRRYIFVVVALALPLAIHADAATDTSTSAATTDASQSVAPSPLQQTGQTGASSQIDSLLQPAGAQNSALQSANASSGGVAQSGTQDIQQSGSSDLDKLLVEGDGDVPHSLASSSNYSWLGYILLVLITATIGTGAVTLWQRRRL